MVIDQNPVRIEAMKSSDYDEVRSLWLSCEGIGLDDRSDSREQINYYLLHNPGMSQVARDGNQLIATILCGHDGRRGYLSHLAVRSEYRGQGIGRLLVQTCLDKLSAAGLPGCNIRMFTRNENGRKFWRALGWQMLDVEVWIADCPDEDN